MNKLSEYWQYLMNQKYALDVEQKKMLTDYYKQQNALRQASQQIAQQPYTQQVVYPGGSIGHQGQATPGHARILTFSYICKACNSQVDAHPTWDQLTDLKLTGLHECPVCVEAEKLKRLGVLETLLETRD